MSLWVLHGPAKLFTIIGRSTWSATQFLVNEMEKYTNTLFVGEPTGGKVNSYGDSRKIILPNSGITVRVSTLWWHGDQMLMHVFPVKVSHTFPNSLA